MSKLGGKLNFYKMIFPGWMNKIRLRPLRISLKAMVLPFLILRYPRMLRQSAIGLRYIEMPLTTRCTLRCAKCASLMPYYNDRTWDLSREDALRDIEILLDTVDQIVEFGLIGGETFLYPHLAEMVERLNRCSRVHKISLVTNATLLPADEQLLLAMRNKKVFVEISDYGAISCRIKELTELLDRNKIRYVIAPMMANWYDFGLPEAHENSEEQMRRQYKACSMFCFSYIKGRIHVCPRSAHGVDLGLIPDHPCDYADLTNQTLSREKRREAVQRILKLDFITACDFCNRGTPLYLKLPTAAEQLKEPFRKLSD